MFGARTRQARVRDVRGWNICEGLSDCDTITRWSLHL